MGTAANESAMLSPHQFRSRRDRRGKRVNAREHQNHPERELKRAIEKDRVKELGRTRKRK